MASSCVLSRVNASTYWEYASAFTLLAALLEDHFEHDVRTIYHGAEGEAILIILQNNYCGGISLD